MKDAIPPRSVQLPRHAREAILVNGLAEKSVPRRASVPLLSCALSAVMVEKGP